MIENPFVAPIKRDGKLLESFANRSDDWPRKWREFNVAVTENRGIVDFLKNEVIDDFAKANDLSIAELFGLLNTYRHIANFMSLRN